MVNVDTLLNEPLTPPEAFGQFVVYLKKGHIEPPWPWTTHVYAVDQRRISWGLGVTGSREGGGLRGSEHPGGGGVTS